ncbi:DNA polymerase delta subunit 3-like [Oscarella lobularis]|uniref:DNA polymerase delta subunit 3-like n=1 Tax=Oscarella lobularis TaxID=121494 RepID=UPI003313E126
MAGETTTRLYLDNIDEYVNDQDKVVTYKWLSRMLSVSANQAKRMLYEFVENQKTKSGENSIDVVYLVTGQRLDNETYVTVVSGDHLDELKQQLSSLLSVHVYSVQKSKLKDSSPLYASDFDALSKGNEWSSIVCNEAVPVADRGRITRINGGASSAERQSVKPAPKQGSENRASNETKRSSMFSKGKETVGSVSQMSSRIGSRAEAMIHEREQKDAGVKKESKPKHETAASSFFGRALTKKKEAKAAPVKSVVQKKEKIVEEASKEEDEKKRKEAEAAVNPSAKKTADNRTSKKPGTKPKKKTSQLKRIKRIEDSDSEEEPEKIAAVEERIDEGSDDALKVSTGSSSSPKSLKPKRKRTKKMKSHTYVDEDGEFVTEKVYESCSTDASEPETESSRKDETGKSVRSGKVPKLPANKQSKLFGFLKKKD